VEIRTNFRGIILCDSYNIAIGSPHRAPGGYRPRVAPVTAACRPVRPRPG